MIQSTPPVRAAATAADSAQPAVARSIGGQSAVDKAQGFSERMSFAAGNGAAPAPEQPAPLLPDALPEAVLAPAAMPTGEGAAEGGELGLLEIIERQLADIEAREAAQPEALHGLPMPSSVAELNRTDGRLGWAANTLPALPEAQPDTQAQALEAAFGDGWQAGPEQAAKPVVAIDRGFAYNNTTQAPMERVAAAASPLPLSPQAITVGSPGGLPLEPLLATTEPLEAGEPLLATERAQAASPQALERALKLQAPEAKWGEQMLHALRENVELQIQQKIQSATIRLDPPELGSMEILLSHESGRLNVQLTAANADVARLLQQSSDRLRHELVGQHFVQVNVQVGADSSGQQGQQRQRAALAGDELPLAAGVLEDEQQDSPAAARARDVLVTV